MRCTVVQSKDFEEFLKINKVDEQIQEWLRLIDAEKELIKKLRSKMIYNAEQIAKHAGFLIQFKKKYPTWAEQLTPPIKEVMRKFEK